VEAENKPADESLRQPGGSQTLKSFLLNNPYKQLNNHALMPQDVPGRPRA
jgi:hypothetical protein